MNLLNVDFKKAYETLRADLDNGLSPKQVVKNRQDFCTKPKGGARARHYFVTHAFDDVMRILFVITAAASYIIYRSSESAASLFLLCIGMICVNTALYSLSRRSSRFNKANRCETVRVRRGGKEMTIIPSALVPGDTVILDTGDCAFCDGVVVDADNLKILEYNSGGKITITEKYTYQQVQSESIDREKLPYHRCLIFADMIVIKGRAEMIAMNVGEDICANENAKPQNDTESMPAIYEKIAFVGKQLSVIWILAALLYFAAGVFLRIEIFDSFRFACLLSVASASDMIASVCEIAIVKKTNELAKKNVIVKRAGSLDMLRDVNCFTVNSVDPFYYGSLYPRRILINNTPYFFKDEHELAHDLISISLLTCPENKGGRVYFQGKSVDFAFVKVARELEISKRALTVGMLPVVPGRYIPELDVSVGLYLRTEQASAALFVRGNPEFIVKHCGTMYKNGSSAFMNESDKFRMLAAAKDFSDDGDLVMAVARRIFNETPQDVTAEIIDDLEFVGFIGLYTPINADAARAVNTCVKNGINVMLMAQGRPDTMYGLAKSVSMISDGDFEYAVTPLEYVRRNRGLFLADLQKYKVFCNLTPYEQSEIIAAHKKDGDIIASCVSGIDGIIPQIQTDVSFVSSGEKCGTLLKNADVVFSRQNLNSVPDCIKAARNIYENIFKASGFMLYWQIALFVAAFLSLICERSMVFTSSTMLILSFGVVIPFAVAMVFDERKENSLFRDKQDSGEPLTWKSILPAPVFTGVATSVLSELVYRGTLILTSSVPASTAAFAATLFSCVCFSAFSFGNGGLNFKLRNKINMLYAIPVVTGIVYFAVSALMKSVDHITGTSQISPAASAFALAAGAVAFAICSVSQTIKFK